jgi:hypothetical protein
MAASMPQRNISTGTASIRSGCVRHCPRGVRTASRERLRRPQACIRGQHDYLVSIMNTLVKNLRLFAHGGCLKAGQ